MALGARSELLYKFLLNKWYFDEIYDFLFVRPAMWLGRLLWKGGDGFIIDGFGPDGVSARVLDVTRNVVRLQTGYLYHYAFAMLIGVAALVTWFMFVGRARMTSWPILSVVTFLPLAGALFIALLQRGRSRRAQCALGSAVDHAHHLCGLADPDVALRSGTADFQFLEKRPWLGGTINYSMGVDGISLPFVILTTALMPISILASWDAIQRRVREYMIAFLVLETLMVGTFCALDLVLFYLFFEGGLIPMFLIIGVWGGPRRVYASFKFFLYTLLGSVLMLLAIMAMYWEAGTTDIPTLLHHAFPRSLQTWAWFAFLASFAVKMPMWPVHTWLPDAHVEAPTAGSVILAAILLKMGGYGFLRFSLPMFPEASQHLAPLIYALSVIAIIYTSLVALMQEDIKKLIAYSSVAHMGFVTMGIFAVTAQGIAGGIFQMISHGIVSAALFLCVGVVYDRMHTREIAAYGGLVNRMPLYAFVFMVFTLANVGLPGTSGFVGEFLTLIGTFRINTWVATLATLGTILSAAYALWLYRKVIFGKLEKPSLFHIRDLGWREMVMLAPLVVLTIVFGVYPKPVLDISSASVTQLMDNYHHALARRAGRGAWRGEAMNAPRTSHARSAAAGDRARPRRHGAVDARRVARRAPVRIVDGAAIALLVIAGVIAVRAARRQADELRRQLRGRRFRPVSENSGAARFGGRHRDVARLRQARAAAAVRIFGSDPALDARHADADLGGRPDRALSRPRIDEPAALCRRRQPSRLAALDRSRAEIFRARRAVVGHAALRRVAGLWIYRHGEFAGIAQAAGQGGDRPDLRHRVSVRRLLFQGFGGAVPYVDARRL